MTHLPQGYHTLTPYLTVHDARAAIDFYRRAFGAEELLRMEMPDGTLAHAEIRIGDSPLMLADENPEWGTTSPRALSGTSGGIMMYVPDVDAAFARAVEAGATVRMPVEDQFYGDRSGQVEDPFGHRWTLSMVKEKLSPEEMDRRFTEWRESQAE
jgi:PhnB protein